MDPEDIQVEITAKEAALSRAKASEEVLVPDPDVEEAAQAILDNLKDS